MSYLRLSRRFILVGLHVLIAALLAPLLMRSKHQGHSAFQKALMQWEMRVCLYLLGVRLKVLGQPTDRPALIVANHISWLDILVIGSAVSSCFLSKAEVQKWPIIGKITIRYGTIFIHRGQDSHIVRDEITRRLSDNTSVTLFPEGTTSDGASVRPFFPRLLAAAIETNTLIQPLTLQYRNGGKRSEVVPFTRDQSLLRHAIGLMKQKHTDAILCFADTIDPQGHDRRSLAEQTHQAVLSKLKP